jgi:hypothetical protein
VVLASLRSPALWMALAWCSACSAAPAVVGSPAKPSAEARERCAEGEALACDELCASGSRGHCADLEIMHLAATGGSPYPPAWRELTSQRFGAACRGGDGMACLLLHLDYQAGAQPVGSSAMIGDDLAGACRVSRGAPRCRPKRRSSSRHR